MTDPLSTFASFIFIFFFFFNDTATTEIYTLSLHDALPISHLLRRGVNASAHMFYALIAAPVVYIVTFAVVLPAVDRKSTRLNSSHGYISYAVFCLKKKKQKAIKSMRPRQRIL